MEEEEKVSLEALMLSLFRVQPSKMLSTNIANDPL